MTPRSARWSCSTPPGTRAGPSTCSDAPPGRCRAARPSTTTASGWPRRRSSCPTWPARCATRSRGGRTIRTAWPRCRSGGDCLAELRRKYGEDLDAVMAYAREGAARLAALDDAEGEAARLQAEHDRRRAELAEAEAAVRATRARAAGAFGDLVGERLGALAMAGARLEVRVAPDGTGEPVELALGANVGEPVQPLARAASGGELARAMLAIRLVGLGGPQTMVFDEVDAGVGGAAALGAGRGAARGGRRPPGPGRHPPGPGGVAGRRADQRGQAGSPRGAPSRPRPRSGARTASRSCRACSRGTRAATPLGPTPASCWVRPMAG